MSYSIRDIAAFQLSGFTVKKDEYEPKGNGNSKVAVKLVLKVTGEKKGGDGSLISYVDTFWVHIYEAVLIDYLKANWKIGVPLILNGFIKSKVNDLGGIDYQFVAQQVKVLTNGS